MLQVTVSGESPIAYSVAAVCAWRGHAVTILSRSPWASSSSLLLGLPDGNRVVAPLVMTTCEARRALSATDILFVCVPPSELEFELSRIAPYVTRNILVGGVPGFGGFGLIARRLLPSNCCIFGTQRIPFVVRNRVPQRSVTLGAVRRQTFVASMPSSRARSVAELLETVWGARTVPMSHYLNVELSPSNSIVNPARLYSLSCQAPGRLRADLEFFLGWNLAASRALLTLDGELQAARRLFPRDTSFVAPILFQYDADGPATLRDRFRGLTALSGRRIPTKRANGEIVWNRQSPYFKEDIDLGLRLIRDLLHLAGAETPFMDEILRWYDGLPGRRKGEKRVSLLRRFDGIEAAALALD